MSDNSKSKNVGSGTRRKKAKRTVVYGIIHINASFNNTIVTITDLQGNTLCWSSPGKLEFKGARKGTPFAAQSAAEEAGIIARDEFGMKRIIILVKGPGPGRDSALRAIVSIGFKLTQISEASAIPHNGPKASKKRRV